MLKIGIIGGSGLYDPDIVKNREEIQISTEYGEPSSPLTKGEIEGVETLILSRHGCNHQFSPTQVNNQANIKALQKMGVTHIIATTACGSLREYIAPGHFVIVDQFIDFTKFRKTTFAESFENGMEHPSMAYPFHEGLRQCLYDSARSLDLKVHDKACVVTIEGPRFSTLAESRMFRVWGADIINMSTAPEAMLANEAGIPYAAAAMTTDYDCWKTDEPLKTWEEILEVFNKNVDKVKKLLVKTVKDFKV